MNVKLTKAQREFLDELAYENPTPAEPWRDRDHWDPPFPLAVIDAMQRRGLIEVRGVRPDCSYRFTPAGRAALSRLTGDGNG